MKQPKPKKCRVCKNDFIPKSSTAIICGFSCACIYTEQQRIKKDAKKALQERQERVKARKKLRTRSWYIKEAQKAVNAFIRERDKDENCISCGKPRLSYDAGHFLARSVRPELRFDEDNIHKQCVYCNKYNKNSKDSYRVNLIKKIGLANVLSLEAPHPPAKWSIDDLIEIRRVYKQKLKAMK